MIRFLGLLILALALAVAVRPGPRATSPSPIRFEDVADRAGLHFAVQHHPTPEKRQVETMPGGVAVFDYNNDGRPDIYFTNGAQIPSLRKGSAQDSNRLFRNDGGMRFTDVTEAAGVAGEGYSNGVAAADYDNDGNIDFFVAGSANLLYHNRGNGTFEEVSAKAGIASGKWAVAAGWFDYDNDGWLDLFVVYYMNWTPESKLYCGDPRRSFRTYCDPKDFAGLTNKLYRNRGDGTFEDVSDRTGIGSHIGRGMSVAFADYDGDGFMDILVTNDQMPNFLFHNIGGKRFEEVALPAGVALLDDGKPISSMGVDFQDYDNDGRPDVSIVALAGETFPLFHNEGGGLFRDATYTSGLAKASARHSGWSPVFADFNNDGLKDLFITRSHVNDRIEEMEASHYKETNMVLLNLGNGKFADVSAGAGDAFAKTARAHRGCALADFDGDGRTDVVVSALGEPAELWRNVTAVSAPYVNVVLRGTRSNRDGVGAVVRVGDQYQIRSSAAGYASSSLQPMHFGGIGPKDSIEIRWPSGQVQRAPITKRNGIQVVVEPK
jgi:hypothetical protein